MLEIIPPKCYTSTSFKNKKCFTSKQFAVEKKMGRKPDTIVTHVMSINHIDASTATRCYNFFF